MLNRVLQLSIDHESLHFDLLGFFGVFFFMSEGLGTRRRKTRRWWIPWSSGPPTNWNTEKPGCQPGSRKCNYLSLGPQRTHWAVLWKANEHRERNEGNQAQYHWPNKPLGLFWARSKSFLPLTVAIESPWWSMAGDWRTGTSKAELGNTSLSHLSLYFAQVSWTDFSLMLNVPLPLCHALLIPTCTCGVLGLIALNSEEQLCFIVTWCSWWGLNIYLWWASS